MGNSRNFRAGRRQHVQTMKQERRSLEMENARLRGQAASLQAQLLAAKMERPADLEEWITEVALPDMSDEEREAFESLEGPERERFMDELGQRINATQLLSEVGRADG